MRKLINELLCDPCVCILWAMMLLLLPLRWIIAVVLAALFHELCHYAAVIACRGRARSFRATGSGLVLDISCMSWSGELLCAAAGPTGSLLLFLLIRWIPLIGFCAGVQFVYNLIPVFPMDGGRILRCLFNIMFCDKGERLWLKTERILIIVILIAAICLVLRFRLGVFPILFACTIVVRALSAKIPCKPAVFRVQ